MNYAAAHVDRIVALQGGRVTLEGIPPGEVLTAERLDDLYGTDVEVREVEGAPWHSVMPDPDGPRSSSTRARLTPKDLVTVATCL